jgi:hypothetical protein
MACCSSVRSKLVNIDELLCAWRPRDPWEGRDAIVHALDHDTFRSKRESR